ncbi:flagellar export chaperone FliS [Anaerobranca gottschalkii]|uniref:Flagellar secretion chaperone FliS n=1 Tax=Anaerobranca gottschalkii DSM 13577 TaxID=1120990 RepID=A0A1H9ZGJ5_9FIRM|nr:flagellar export chaperone FliS [Anaerobranca gottschalkii]SES80789.1 flagellar protein FliS [Anaerobranca gottschalkii DSM 13577]
MLNNPYQQYRQTQIQTASPGELVLMLYNGAIKNINNGLEHLDKGEKQEFRQKIDKALDIVTELMVNLKPEGGEITKNLSSLYDFVIHRLITGSAKYDQREIKEGLSIITGLRDTWKEMLDQSKKKLD